MQTFGAALHDINSHGASAFAEYAFNCQIVPAIEDAPPVEPVGLPLNQITYDQLLDFEDGPRREQRA